MPLLTRTFIKTAMICLALALAIGIWMAADPPFTLFPIYIHLLVFGWLTQLIFGVVFWMFPKFSAEKPRGSETLGWWTYALLNLGLLLRVIAEPLQTASPGPVSAWMLVISALLQFLAGLAFTLNTWTRVREK